METLDVSRPLLSLSILSAAILLLSYLLGKLRQPYLIAYVLAGVLLGPYVGRIFTESESIANVGEIGILLLLFFLGMEIEIPDERSTLLKPVLAQVIKSTFSIIFVLALAKWLHWGSGNVLLLIVLMVLNSTTVVSDYLRKNRELDTAIGKTILNMLLFQDILLAPIIVLFQFVGGNKPDIQSLIVQVTGAILIFLFLHRLRHGRILNSPLVAGMVNDHELQVFLGFCLCLCFALIASLFNLPASLGSFGAGLYIGREPAFRWLEKTLHPFKVFFIALFFVSVGLRLDVPYLFNHFFMVVLITLGIIAINSILSACVFRLLKYNWRNSIYAGAMLSQTGEFGLVAGTLAYSMHIIDADFHKLIVTVICLTLLLSTVWITILRKFIYADNKLFNS